MRKRELDLVVVELSDMGADALGGLQCLDINNVNGGGTSAMTTSHVLVQLCNRLSSSGSTLLVVAVDGAAAGVVSHPNTKVLNLAAILKDLVQGQDLTVRLLELL